MDGCQTVARYVLLTGCINYLHVPSCACTEQHTVIVARLVPRPFSLELVYSTDHKAVARGNFLKKVEGDDHLNLVFQNIFLLFIWRYFPLGKHSSL